MNRKWTFVLAAVLLAAAAWLYNKYRIAPEIDFRQLQLTDLYGNEVLLKQYAGEKTFVGFFATWCGPCIGEIHKLEMANKELKAKGVEFVLISDEPIERLQRFDFNKSLRVTIIHSDKSLKELGIHTIPTNYILNSQFKVERKMVDGSGKKLEELLNSLR